MAQQGENQVRLRTHDQTPIVRHVKVQGRRSPFDGDWSYWGTRRGKHPELPTRIAKLLKRQQGKCSHCGLCFNSDDLLEVHHVDDKHQNHQWDNLTLLHQHCHTKFIRVCMTSTQWLRSRMKRKVHVRFCRRVGRATVRLSLTIPQRETISSHYPQMYTWR